MLCQLLNYSIERFQSIFDELTNLLFFCPMIERFVALLCFWKKTNQFAIYIVTVFMRDSKIGSTNSILFERVNKLGCGNENAGIL
jgi:hypothetical protein